MAKKYDPLKANRSSHYSQKPHILSREDRRSGDSFGKSYKQRKTFNTTFYRAPKARIKKSSNSNNNSLIGTIFAYLVMLPFLIVGFAFFLIIKVVQIIIGLVKKQKSAGV